MSRQHLSALIFATLLIVFPSYCPAPNYLNEEQSREVYTYLSAKWRSVEFKKPLGFDSVFTQLPRHLWPALPESYEWRVTNHTVGLYKHKNAASHVFDFVTYVTDSDFRYNFLSRWDGVTHQSFAYTRQNSPLNGDHPARDVYPIPQFTLNGQSYMRGHCIDFVDTWGLTERSRVSGMTIVECVSTLDPRNYVPEPLNPSGRWGAELRNNLVETIRKNNGCYSQYMYYGSPYTKTDDASNTAIPNGIFFLETDKDKRLLKSFHVPWDQTHKVHTAGSTLDDVLDANTFFPCPFVHDTDKEINIIELQFDFLLQDGVLPYKQYHNLVRYASYEIKNIVGKASLITYLIMQNEKPEDIQVWLKHLIRHGIAIHQNGGYGFMMSPSVIKLMDRLNGAPYVDPTGLFRMYLVQLCSNDQDDAKVRDKTTFKSLPRLKDTKRVEVIQKPVDIDVKTLNFYQTNQAVHTALKTSSAIHLQNLSTAKAGDIATFLSSVYTTDQLRAGLTILYTPDPSNRQSSGVIKKFKERGLLAQRMESSSFLSTSSTDSSRSNSSIILSPKAKQSTSKLDLSESSSADDELLDKFLALSRAEQIEQFCRMRSHVNEIDDLPYSPVKVNVNTSVDDDISTFDDDNEGSVNDEDESGN